MATDDGATVRALLAAAGISPPDDEVEAMIQMYPTLRASADVLYTPEASRFLPAVPADRRESGGTVNGELPSTIAEAAAALRDGTISSLALTEGLFARADAHDATLGTYVARFDETALAAAAEADADFTVVRRPWPSAGHPARREGHHRGARGARTDRVQQGARPRLGPRHRRAGGGTPARQGAVITGKTTTMEFAMGVPDEDGPFPTHRNPWNLERWPGGSSVGTGTGVAAGLILVGSAATPAAACASLQRCAASPG